MEINGLLTTLLAMDLKWLLLLYAVFYLLGVGVGYPARNGSIPYIMALSIPVAASVLTLIIILVKSGWGAGAYGGIVANLVVIMSVGSQIAIVAIIVDRYSD